MKRYLYDNQFILTGEIEVSKFDTFPHKSTLIEPPKLGRGEFAVFRGKGWAIITERPIVPVTVPQMVTKAQARLALYDAGKLAEVEAALNALENPRVLIEWETRETLSRDRDLVNIVLADIGMIDSEIDDLFILAASL